RRDGHPAEGAGALRGAHVPIAVAVEPAEAAVLPSQSRDLDNLAAVVGPRPVSAVIGLGLGGLDLNLRHQIEPEQFGVDRTHSLCPFKTLCTPTEWERGLRLFRPGTGLSIILAYLSLKVKPEKPYMARQKSIRFC